MISPYIHTYYDSTPLLPGQGELLKIWAQSWSDHGWIPQILHPRSGMDHPMRTALYERASELAVSPVTLARIMRWLPMDKLRGGWLCDYDVINYGITPEGLVEACGAFRKKPVVVDPTWALFHVTMLGARDVVRKLTLSSWRGQLECESVLFHDVRFTMHRLVSPIEEAVRLDHRPKLVHFDSAGSKRVFGPEVTKPEAMARYAACKLTA